jgi:hypothetical protein
VSLLEEVSNYLMFTTSESADGVSNSGVSCTLDPYCSARAG